MVTQADIDSLTAAIVAGVRSVTIGGQSIVYNTSASLIEARDRLQAQFNAQNQTVAPAKQFYGYQAGRGYD